MDEKVCIILLNYNNPKDTIECVESLYKIDYSNYEIIIVDNKSTDNSLEILNKELGNKKKLHIISSKKNGGFAYGNNFGIEYAKGLSPEYILLLNNDTLVCKDFLKELVESFEEDKNIGLTTGKILYNDKKDVIWYGGGEIDWNKFYGYHYQGIASNENNKEQGKFITFATGCLMLIKTEVLNKIGNLPKEYFMYYEDVDFSAKLLENGYKIYYNPKALIYHKVSSATGGEESPFAVKWNTRNRIIFMNKYKYKSNDIKFFLSKSYFYTTRIIKITKYILKGESNKALAVIKGIKESKIKIK